MKHLDDFVKVEIPIKWLVILWHFWNDNSAQHAFFKQYTTGIKKIDYRMQAEEMLTEYHNFNAVMNMLKVM